MTQYIRLIDVFYVGVILILIGTFIKMPTILRIQLITIGFGTIIYNGINFVDQYKKEQCP